VVLMPTALKLTKYLPPVQIYYSRKLRLRFRRRCEKLICAAIAWKVGISCRLLHMTLLFLCITNLVCLLYQTHLHTVILSDDAEADLFRVVDPVDFCLSNFRLTDSNLQGSGVKTMQLTPVFRCVVDGPGPVIIETYSRTNTLCQGRKTDVYGG
jgi:hypothetical protein